MADRAIGTIQQYLASVRRFEECLGLDLTEADQGSIRRWVEHLQGQPIGPERLRCHDSALSPEQERRATCRRQARRARPRMGRVRFLYGKTLGQPEKVSFLSMPRKDAPLPTVLTAAEVQRVLDGFLVAKYPVFFALIYATGLRICEASISSRARETPFLSRPATGFSRGGRKDDDGGGIPPEKAMGMVCSFRLRTAMGCALLLLLLVASLPLRGQPAGVELKLHLGWGLRARDQLQEHLHGAGLDLGWALPMGRLGVELAWMYKPGDPFYEAPGSPASGKAPVDLASRNVGDRRRNGIEGFALRLSFRRPLGGSGLAWQAGLQFGGNRFTHEYEADLRSAPWNPATANAWRDVYYGTPRRAAGQPSPWAGIRFPLGQGGALEVNALLFTYDRIHLLHVPGGAEAYPLAGTQGPLAADNAFPLDRLETTTRRWPHLEVAYAFRF